MSDKIIELVSELIALLDREEESEAGIRFKPNQIDSCRILDGIRINNILLELRRLRDLNDLS